MKEDGACDAPFNADPNQADADVVQGALYLSDITMQVQMVLEDLRDAAPCNPGDLWVIGASSSEVIGQRIGTATSMEVGRSLIQVILAFVQKLEIDVAFQCCEHLNRSLVVEKHVAIQKNLSIVQAIPVPGAGGAVASAAYFAMNAPVLVSNIAADAGIDIGDTLIGMHLKPVAVPVRGRIREIGQAHVTLARTRAPFIGGSRAVYNVEEAKRRLGSSGK